MRLDPWRARPPLTRSTANLMITATLFSPTADGGARVLSYQHADPRGSIPPGVRSFCFGRDLCVVSDSPASRMQVVNLCVTRGKEQLKDMRNHMIRLAGK